MRRGWRRPTTWSGRDDVGLEPDGAASEDELAARRGLRSRLLWPLLGGLAIVSAALAIIVWLPLDAEVEADIKEALVGYETSREVAWPASEPLALPLSTEDQTALATEAERELEQHAVGDALASFDAEREVARFLRVATTDRPWVVTNWDGDVVSFDFVRQTLRGEVIVRAGVRRAHQVGRMNEEKQRIVARRWIWDDGADIYEYALRDDGMSWKVVKTSHWGTCGPEGENVVEGAQEF